MSNLNVRKEIENRTVFTEERAEVCECTALGNVYVSNGKTRCSICTGIVDFGEQHGMLLMGGGLGCLDMTEVWHLCG